MSISPQMYGRYCSLFDTLPIDENLCFFESHNSTDLAGNMLAIARELSDEIRFPYLQIVISCTVESEARIRTLIERYHICAKLVYRESDGYLSTLASAQFLFTDVAYWPLYRKKPGQVCITTWHGTPLKTLGFTYNADSYVVANQKRGFCLSDYFVCPNEYTWNCIRKSYQLDSLFHGTVLYSGYPRNSVFFDIGRRGSIRQELGNEKKIIVYMPTWRGKVTEVKGKDQSLELQDYLDELDALLPDDTVFITKLHRLNDAELDYSSFRHIIRFPSDYETYDILNAADCLVTDYSSVMFDYLNTGKKIVLFCYDCEDYIQNRTCYFDIWKLPFPIVETVHELASELSTAKKYDDNEVKAMFCSYDGLLSTEKLVRHIFGGRSSVQTENCKNHKQKKALLYTGDLAASYETDALFLFISNSKKQFYITYMNHLFLKSPYKLLQFGNMNQMPMYMYDKRYAYYTPQDESTVKKIKSAILASKPISPEWLAIMDEIYRRDYVRYMYQNRFDCFVRYNGLDLESLKWFAVFGGKKILYVHTSMIKKSRINLEYRFFLSRAMMAADEVHFANRNVYSDMKVLYEGKIRKVYIENLY